VTAYNVVSLDEIERVEYLGSNLIPVRYTLGFRPAGTNAWFADTGGQLVPPHEEDAGSEELYVVVRGRAKFTVGAETGDAPKGTVVYVPPEVHRTAVAEEDGTVVLAVGGRIGEPFRGGAWDSFAIADAHRRAGRTEEGREVLRQARDEHPERMAPVYNSACWEALAGNTDEAIEYLRQAVEIDAKGVRPYLEEDTDLDPLRDDPRFQELLA